ncbi:LIM and calponin homology domains-containing protein 1-like [Salvelinus fontinalis]|uniref:LIM and calponin homology domains-containing protein 1-like n=1 Tax=Salvelinus fontinalis TaxID=8038 RepID=UPI002485B13B|nr:LIM and calponin homology domains-containing protein 1-like [Salvelinus fontinalis]
MASTGAEREEPHLPRDEPRHPEPAFREAQKWIEEVTGKSFGEKDFRSGLENGILLCELLCSIRPGLVQKINRLPSPIAGLVSTTKSNGFTNTFLHQQMSQSAVQKPSLKPQTPSNAGVEAQRLGKTP